MTLLTFKIILNIIKLFFTKAFIRSVVEYSIIIRTTSYASISIRISAG